MKFPAVTLLKNSVFQYILLYFLFLSEKLYSLAFFLFTLNPLSSCSISVLHIIYIFVDFVSTTPLSFVFPIHSLSGAQHWLSRCPSPSSRPSSRYQSGPNASLPTRPPSRPPSRPSRPPSHPSAHGSPAPLSTLPKRLSLEGTKTPGVGHHVCFFFFFALWHGMCCRFTSVYFN